LGKRALSYICDGVLGDVAVGASLPAGAGLFGAGAPGKSDAYDTGLVKTANLPSPGRLAALLRIFGPRPRGVDGRFVEFCGIRRL